MGACMCGIWFFADVYQSVNFDFKNYLGRRNEKSFFWKPIKETEDFDNLYALDAKKSHGYDKLPVKLVKDAISTFSCSCINPLCSRIYFMVLKFGKLL